jgi:hypothetical protein
VRFARALLSCCLVACSEADEVAREPLTLRVSTHFGLANLEPDLSETGAAHFVRLVYRPLHEQYSGLQLDGSSVRLTPKPGARPELIRHPALKKVRRDADAVVMELDDPVRARNLLLESQLIDSGPYVQEAYEGDTLRLRRRNGKGPEVIEVKNVPTEEEEWRRFLAREIDVLPYGSPRHLQHLREVPSVRVLEMQRPVYAGLHFRIRDGSSLADVRLRRAIALGIRRGALAEVITGDRGGAVGVEENLAEAQRLAAEAGTPIRLRTLVYGAGSEFRRAALVLEQQLALLGVDLAIETLTVEELGSRIRQSDWDAWLFFGAYEPDYYYYVRTGDLGNVAGYSNPEVDAAIAAGDHAAVRALLARDVPFTPLYRIGDGAALDRSLCSDRPYTTGDMSWLATVHRCGPEELE